jgi:hypothetical protein
MKMARKRGQTIDWSAWKLEFIESDYFEVKGFLRDLKGI